MTDKAHVLVFPAMFAVALGLAWAAMGGISSAPSPDDLPPLPPRAAAVVEPAPAYEPPAVPVVRPAPPAAAAGTQPIRPSWGDGERPRPSTFFGGKPGDVQPLRQQRVQDATLQATSRRIDMMDRMFEAAPLAVGDDGDRERVRDVLQGTLDRMRGLEARVESGDLTYRDAVTEMDGLRDEAAEQIDGLLPEDEADAVKARMGIRPPPDPSDVVEWEGVPFEEAFKDWQ